MGSGIDLELEANLYKKNEKTKKTGLLSAKEGGPAARLQPLGNHPLGTHRRPQLGLGRGADISGLQAGLSAFRF